MNELDTTLLEKSRNRIFATVFLIATILVIIGIPDVMHHKHHGPEYFDDIVYLVAVIPLLIFITLLFLNKKVLGPFVAFITLLTLESTVVYFLIKDWQGLSFQLLTMLFALYYYFSPLTPIVKRISTLVLIPAIFIVPAFISRDRDSLSFGVFLLVSYIICLGIFYFVKNRLLKRKSDQSITEQPLVDGATDEEVDEEALKLEKRRKNFLAIVLIINSFLGLVLVGVSLRFGIKESFTTNQIVALIIDSGIAIALFKGKDLLKLVYIRTILGLIIWLFVLVTAKDFISIPGELVYSGLLIYLVKMIPSNKSLRWAKIILAGVILILITTFIYGFVIGFFGTKQFNKKIEIKAQSISATYSQERELLYSNTNDFSDQQKIIAWYQKILDINKQQNTQLHDMIDTINEGLSKYRDPGSQANLSKLNKLYQAELIQNQAIEDLANFVVSLDLTKISNQQSEQYKLLSDKVDQEYNNVAAVSKE